MAALRYFEGGLIMTDYNYLITELVNYGCNNNLVDELDRMLTINRLVELLDLDEYIEPEEEIVPRELHFILERAMIIPEWQRPLLACSTV